MLVITTWVGSSRRHVGTSGFLQQEAHQAEAVYSTFDRELLACVAAIKHFRYLLEGQKFFIWSDHKLLTYTLHRV